jgi:hypothetical protein
VERRSVARLGVAAVLGVAVLLVAVATVVLLDDGSSDQDGASRPSRSSRQSNGVVTSPPPLHVQLPGATPGPPAHRHDHQASVPDYYSAYLYALLRRAGFTDVGADHGYVGAVVDGTYRGRLVQVTSTPDPADPAASPGTSLGSRRVGGMPVRLVRSSLFGEVAVFSFGVMTYQVASFPAGSAQRTSDRQHALQAVRAIVPLL